MRRRFHCHLGFRLLDHVNNSGRDWTSCMNKTLVLKLQTVSHACIPIGMLSQLARGGGWTGTQVHSHRLSDAKPQHLRCFNPWTPWLCLKLFSSLGEGKGVQGSYFEPDKFLMDASQAANRSNITSFRRSQIKIQKKVFQDVVLPRVPLF